MKAFVTGASEGLGRAFAVRLAEKGYSVTAVARNSPRLEELMEELGGDGHDFMALDLSTRDGVDGCIERLRTDGYQLLVNNAGYSRFGDYAEADVDDELRVLAVNCEAAMALAHAYLGAAKPGDALINRSSLTYVLPTPIQPTYVATKAFLGSFSESLWYQQRARGVYVQGLCPGMTRTRFIERAGLTNFLRLMDFISAPPERVVNVSLRALERRRGPIVVPGLGNKAAAWLFRLLPRRISVSLMGRIGGLAEHA